VGLPAKSVGEHVHTSPQFSGDLVTWANSTATPTALSDDGSYQIVSVPYPPFSGGKKAHFFRFSAFR